MMDKEKYKRELIRMWDSLRTENKGKKSCDDVPCQCCPLKKFVGCNRAQDIFDIVDIVEKWSKEHPPKHKISQLEYNILETFANKGFACYFSEYNLLMSLLKKGYFQGADEKMNIDYYFNHCEVVEDECI